MKTKQTKRRVLSVSFDSRGGHGNRHHVVGVASGVADVDLATLDSLSAECYVFWTGGIESAKDFPLKTLTQGSWGRHTWSSRHKPWQHRNCIVISINIEPQEREEKKQVASKQHKPTMQLTYGPHPGLQMSPGFLQVTWHSTATLAVLDLEAPESLPVMVTVFITQSGYSLHQG
jgi:hypothetical protein